MRSDGTVFQILLMSAVVCIFFFSIWVFFHEHSRFTGQQGKGEGIYLTPLYHFHPLHRHLDISRAIAAESSPFKTFCMETRLHNILKTTNTAKFIKTILESTYKVVLGT